jgi:hypothetical protein
MSLTAEEIEANFQKFKLLCGKLEERTDIVLKMLDVIGESLALAPASSKKQFHCAYPGGLVAHSIRVLTNAQALAKTFNAHVNRSALILASLFHDIGKIGHLVDGKIVDYYIPQTSQWHRERGEEYTINQSLPYMTVPHRSVWLMQEFGVKLSYEEWLAIMLNDGYIVPENKVYGLKEPMLAHLVMTADYIATMTEKKQSECF